MLPSLADLTHQPNPCGYYDPESDDDLFDESIGTRPFDKLKEMKARRDERKNAKKLMKYTEQENRDLQKLSRGKITQAEYDRNQGKRDEKVLKVSEKLGMVIETDNETGNDTDNQCCVIS